MSRSSISRGGVSATSNNHQQPTPDPNQTLETKVVILGHTGVGKTSMLTTFVQGHFPIQTTATIGAAFMKKSVRLNDWTVVLQIWDTAGQERFRSMLPMYYRNAQAAILCYDIAVPETLEKISSWVTELQSHIQSSSLDSPPVSPSNDLPPADDILMVLAGNKSDLRATSLAEQCVSPEVASNFAANIPAPLFEVSAKTGDGIEALFRSIAEQLLDRHLRRIGPKAGAHLNDKNRVKLDGKKERDTGPGCCS